MSEGILSMNKFTVYSLFFLIGTITIVISLINIYLGILLNIIIAIIWLIILGLKTIDLGEKTVLYRKKTSILGFSILLFVLASIIRVTSILIVNAPLEKAAIFVLATGLLLAEKRDLREFGFSLMNFKRQILFALIFSILIPGTYLVILGSMLKLFADAFFSFSIKVFIIVLPFYLVVGLGEEGLFRAYIERQAVQSIGYRKGILWASFLFGIWHIYWHIYPLSILPMITHVLFAFLFGLIFGMIYEKTNSVFVVTLIHACWDAMVNSIYIPMLNPSAEYIITGTTFFLFFSIIILITILVTQRIEPLIKIGL